MDELPRHPIYDMDDSPAAGVKTRTRVRAKRASSSSKDNEQQPTTKRRYKKKGTKVNVEAKLGVQAGGAELSEGLQNFFPDTKPQEDTKPPPPQKPLFGFDSPQESWLEASENPSPTNSVKFHRHSARFYSSVELNVPSIPVDESNKPSGRKIYLGPSHVSPVHFRYSPRGLMNDPDLFGPGRQYSFTTTPTPNEAGGYAMEAQTSSSASKAMPSGATNEVCHMDDSNADPMIDIPSNKEMHISGVSSGSPNRSSSSTNGLYNSPYSLPLSGKNLTQERNSSAGGLDMAFNESEAANVTDWQPAGLLCMDNQTPESQYALLVLNQPIQNLNMLKLIWKKAFFRIAADGGANRLSDAFKDPCLNEDFEKIGLEVICGDLDSLFSRVRDDAQRRGTKVVEDPDQNSTDFTKGIAYLRGNVFSKLPSASNIVCLGGLGGRVDQALSQLHHLYMEQQDPHYKNGRIYLLSTEGITFVLKRGKHRIRVYDPRSPVLGKHIGIIPLKEPSVITTKGLKWDVTDWPTEFGGQISTSNHVREDVVEITTIGDVLFTIDLNFPPGNHEHPGLRRELSPIISMEDDMFFGIGTNSYPY